MTPRQAILEGIANSESPGPAQLAGDILLALALAGFKVVPVPMDDGAAELVERARRVVAECWPTADVIEQLALSLDRHRAWVADLMVGTYVNCVYCGHRYGPSETTPASRADMLKAHIAACPEHPMAELLRVAAAASSALKSYAHGNNAVDLAAEVAASVDAAIAKAKGRPS